MSAQAPKTHYIHATAIAIDHHGILISGPSKAGKSSLAEALIAAARAAGNMADFIGDDRIGLIASSHGIEIHPHPAIAGLIERRGFGIEPIPYRDRAIARLEIALTGATGDVARSESIERLPGHRLPLLVVAPRPPAQQLLPLVLTALPQ